MAASTPPRSADAAVGGALAVDSTAYQRESQHHRSNAGRSAIPAAKPSTKRASIKAKREAIAKAYGCPPDAGMEDYFYSRRRLAKVSRANRHGWHELRYTDEVDDLRESIPKTLDRIRERDGMTFFNESAGDLLAAIAFLIKCRTGPRGLRRAMDKLKRDVAA